MPFTNRKAALEKTQRTHKRCAVDKHLAFDEILFAFTTTITQAEFYKGGDLAPVRVNHPDVKIAVTCFAAANEVDGVDAVRVGQVGVANGFTAGTGGRLDALSDSTRIFCRNFARDDRHGIAAAFAARIAVRLILERNGRSCRRFIGGRWLGWRDRRIGRARARRVGSARFRRHLSRHGGVGWQRRIRWNWCVRFCRNRGKGRAL